MKTVKRRAWLALLMVVVIASAALLLSRKPAPPQVITLPTGEQFQFIAAEWGTNEVQPSFAARLVARLPTSLAVFVMRKLGPRLGIVTLVGRPWYAMGQTPLKPPDPSLHFWFRCIQTNSVGPVDSFKFMLADDDGVIGGMGNGGWSSYGQGKNKWLTFTLPVAPRRCDTLQLVLFRADNQFNGPFHQIGTVRFPNPRFGHFPNWQPEPVPATKRAGDLQVRLTDFTVAAANSGNAIASINGKQTRFHPPAPGENQEAVFRLDIHSPRGTNEAWLVEPAELSDATGNRAQAAPCSRWSITDEYYLGPALWPDESAWRLTLTLRRCRGYDSEEVLTFTNVPVPAVGATNTFFQTNSVHGVPVLLKQEFIREPDRTPVVLRGSMSATRVVVELVNPPEGWVVDFVQLNADTGWRPKEWSNWQTANSAVVTLFSIPPDVRSLDLTWAVQKVRTVEFLVKPPKP